MGCLFSDVCKGWVDDPKTVGAKNRVFRTEILGFVIFKNETKRNYSKMSNPFYSSYRRRYNEVIDSLLGEYLTVLRCEVYRLNSHTRFLVPNRKTYLDKGMYVIYSTEYTVHLSFNLANRHALVS
jgi:leucyl aminopeptidase (aminopeptidase T)